MVLALSSGFATSLSLILAIGAQNAFVLRQGLVGRHVFALCLFCALSDAVLIGAGVAGFASVSRIFPMLPRVLTLAGAGFLLVYGAVRLLGALRGGAALEAGGEGKGMRATLLAAAAFTWLNPHVYLDTLGLVGAVSTGFVQTDAKWAFWGGAVGASFLFFFSLGYGAKLLAPVMRAPRAWQLLDLTIAVVMWTLAAGLLSGLAGQAQGPINLLNLR